MKLSLLFRKRWLWLYLPVMLLSALFLWLSAAVWLPLPPTSMVMAGGLPSGSYIAMAIRYRDTLETHGIRVETITTESSADPLKRLLDPQNGVDAGFAQGLLAKPDMAGIFALAAVERSAVWIFTRLPNVTQLPQLKGMRIATSSTGNSGLEITQLLMQHALLIAPAL